MSALAVIMLVSLLDGRQSSPSPDPHAAMESRGAMVMAFDQEKTRHHFYLYENGGAIDVTTSDPADTPDTDAIRRHLPHLAMMFAAGNFNAPMLVHDAAAVPGTGVMAERRNAISYRYADTRGGGRVTISTSDPVALAAIHEFLRYQIREHRTGDPLTLPPRQ